ncbi:MAG: DUF1579 domain-containing protein [Pirellulales bacterium]
MKRNLIAAALVAACGIALIAGTRSLADSATSTAPAGQGEMQLPPGWTMEDMQAMMAAGTPGKMHKRLADDIGTWECKTQMWMQPNGEPMESVGTSIVKPLMDGRYVQVEMNGDMPGMGPYTGLGIYGFDNITQKFVSTWIDNHGTGIMTGTGELSADGKTITWEFTGNCPLTKQPMTMKEVETVTGPNTKTLEMFGPDPKTGEVFKHMRIEMTRN